MATKLFKDMQVKIDSAPATLADITAYVSSCSIRSAQDTLEDTALSDEERSYLFGLAGANTSMAGFLNTTTDGIFGPLKGNRTTVAKTFQYREYANSTGAGRFYNGELLITSIEYSGAAGSLQTFSVEGVFDGLLNRSSVTTT